MATIIWSIFLNHGSKSNPYFFLIKEWQLGLRMILKNDLRAYDTVGGQGR